MTQDCSGCCCRDAAAAKRWRPQHSSRRSRRSPKPTRALRGAWRKGPAARWPQPTSNPRRAEIFGGARGRSGLGPGRATLRRPPSTAAIASPEHGLMPAAAATRSGSAATRQLVDAEGPCLGPDGKPAERTMLFPKTRGRGEATSGRSWGSRAPAATPNGHRPVCPGALRLHPRIGRRPPREPDRSTAFTTYQIYGAGFAASRARDRSRHARCLHRNGGDQGADARHQSRCVRTQWCSPRWRAGGRMAIVTSLSDADAARDVGTVSREREPHAYNSAQRCGLRRSTPASKPRSRRSRLSHRRRLGDIREPGVRAAAARHSRGDASRCRRNSSTSRSPDRCCSGCRSHRRLI